MRPPVRAASAVAILIALALAGGGARRALAQSDPAPTDEAAIPEPPVDAADDVDVTYERAAAHPGDGV